MERVDDRAEGAVLDGLHQLGDDVFAVAGGLLEGCRLSDPSGLRGSRQVLTLSACWLFPFSVRMMEADGHYRRAVLLSAKQNLLSRFHSSARLSPCT
jgi:hypothetical protein